MPTLEKNFIAKMKTLGEKGVSQASIIELIIDNIKEVFGDANFLITYQDLATKVSDAYQKLFSIKADESSALSSAIGNIGTQLSACVSAAGVTGTTVGNAIGVMTAVSSLGFVLYGCKQKKLAAWEGISFLDDVLKSHVYVDLLKRYLEENKSRYDSTMALDRLLIKIIKDFSEEIAVLLYIRHACLIQKLSPGGNQELLAFFKESINDYIEHAPYIFTVGEEGPVQCLLRATFPQFDSNIFYNTNGHRIMRTLDQQYVVEYYLHYADRLELDLSHNDPKVLSMTVKKNHEALPMVRIGGPVSKYFKHYKPITDTLDNYPPIMFFQQEAAKLSLVEFKSTTKSDTSEINFAESCINIYLAYKAVNSMADVVALIDKLNTVIRSSTLIADPLTEQLESQAVDLKAQLSMLLVVTPEQIVNNLGKEIDALRKTMTEMLSTILNSAFQIVESKFNALQKALQTLPDESLKSLLQTAESEKTTLVLSLKTRLFAAQADTALQAAKNEIEHLSIQQQQSWAPVAAQQELQIKLQEYQKAQKEALQAERNEAQIYANFDIALKTLEEAIQQDKEIKSASKSSKDEVVLQTIIQHAKTLQVAIQQAKELKTVLLEFSELQAPIQQQQKTILDIVRFCEQMKEKANVLDEGVSKVLSKLKDAAAAKISLDGTDPDCDSGDEDNANVTSLADKRGKISKKHTKASALTTMYNDKAKKLTWKIQQKQSSQQGAGAGTALVNSKTY